MINILYYENYQISEEFYFLDDYQKKVLMACCYMVDNKTTLRITAENCGYSTTTLWRRIHKECKQISPELYKCVCNRMRLNLERGFKNAKHK